MNCILTRVYLATAALLIAAASAQAEERWYYSGFVGVLTEGRWHEVITPGQVEFADSGLIGGAVGWERQIRSSRFSYGFEAQAVRHFGRQDHFEFNLPVVFRYRPANPFPRRLESAAFGIGLSHATEIPQVEIDRKGASQRNFVYWMAEFEFSVRRSNTTAFVRLHHRSDGYGLFDVSSGSSAAVFGLRHAF